MPHFLLIREDKDGTIQGIRFDEGILARMQIDEYEWKPIPMDPVGLRNYIEKGR